MPPDRFQNSLVSKLSGSQPTDGAEYYGGFLKELDHYDHHLFDIPAEQKSQLSPEVKLLLETAWEVFEDAGYPISRLNQLQAQYNQGIGVYMGAMYNQYSYRMSSLEEAALYSNSSNWQLANRLSHFFNLTGPSLTVNTACSSSLTAIHLACQSLKDQECMMAIAGGVNLTLDASKYAALKLTKFLGHGNKSKSFGDGDGFIPSEGVGVVLLKPLQAAKKDGDKIYGVIKSSFINHGGGRQTYTAPDPKHQEQLILRSLERSGVHPETISYVESAANGSGLGDPIEVVALTKAFNKYTQKRQFCAIGSVKSNLGHLEASSGISQLTKVLLQLKYKTLVPSINADPLNPNIEFETTPFYLQEQVSPWTPQAQPNEAASTPRRAMINSFGAGGAYANLIVEEYSAETPSTPGETTDPNEKYLLVFSAKTEWSLQQYLQKIKAYVEDALSEMPSGVRGAEGHSDISMRDLALTLQLNRNHLDKRIAIIAASWPELIGKISAISWQSGEFMGDGIYSSIDHRGHTEEPMDQASMNKAIEARDLDTIAQYWVKGQSIPPVPRSGGVWEALHDGTAYQMVDLPGYAFDHQAASDLNQNNLTPAVEDALRGEEILPFEEQFYRTVLEGVKKGELTPDAALALTSKMELI